MRTGRPTNDPKKYRLEIRLTESQKQELEYCVKALNKNRTDILLAGLKRIVEDVEGREMRE